MVRFVKVILFLSLGCLFLVAITPLILSSSWGKKKCIQAINYFSDGTVEIESLKLGWISSQKIENISWQNEAKTFFFSCKEIKTEAPLWKIFFQQDAGHLTLSCPYFSFEENAPTQKKEQETVRPRFVNELPKNKDHLFFPHFFVRKGHLTVKEGKGNFKNLQLEEIDLKLIIQNKEEVWVDFFGKTVDPKTAGTFHFSGIFQDKESFRGKAKVVNLPLQIIAEYLPIPLSQELLSCDVEIQSTPQNLEISLDASSSQFSIYAKAETKEGIISLKTPALITWQIPSALIPELPPSLNATLRINELSFPLNDRKALKFQTDFSLSNEISLSLSTENFKEGIFSLSLHSPLISFENATFLKKETLSLQEPLSLYGQAEGIVSTLVIPPLWQDLKLEGEFLFPFLDQGKVVSKVEVDTLKKICLKLQTQDFCALLEGELDLKNKLFCSTKEGRVNYVVPQELSSLREPLALQIELDSFIIPLSNPSPLYMRGKVQTNQVPLPFFSLKKPSLEFEIEKESAKLLLKSEIEGGYLTLDTTFFSIFDHPLDHFILHMKAHSDVLKADLHLKKENESLTLLRPTKIEYLLKDNPFVALKESAKLSLELTKLYIPSFSSSAFEIQGDFFIDQCSLAQEPLVLNHLKIHVERPSSQMPLSFQLNGTTSGKGLVVSHGSFEPSSGTLDAHLSLQNLPSNFLDLFITEPLPSAILGPTVHLFFSTQLKEWQGDVKLNINSLLARLALEGTIQKGTLSLKETLHAQISLSPQLEKTLLKDFPIRSEFPFTLEIPKEGFRLPLYPFSTSQIQAPKMHLELGKIVYPNKGNVGLLLSLLNLSTFSQAKDIRLWFAPLDLSLESGIISLERADVLIEDRYQVCQWGEFNFLKDKLRLNLGLTSSCLQKAFKIDHLPEEYVLQIPLKGNFGNMRIDKTKATNKVAQLLLFKQQATAKENSSSLLKEFLGKTSLLPDFDFQVPPAKKPLPWDLKKDLVDVRNKQEESLQDPTSLQKELLEKKLKKEFNPEEKPLKQLLKMLR